MLAVPMVSLSGWASEPPPLPPPVDEVMKELRRIESAAWRGQVDAVRIELEKRVKSRPNDPMPKVYVAWCSMPTDDAWNQLKNTSQLFPEVPWVHYGMGRIYVGWKMKDLARSSLDKVLKQDPSFYPALVALGDLERAKDNLDDSEAKYRAALKLADDAEAHAGLGLVLLKKNQPEAALPELKKAIAGWPDQPVVLRELIKLQQASKDPAVLSTASALAALQPRDRDVRRVIAKLHDAAGDKAEALKDYEKLLALGNPDLESAIRIQQLYRDVGDAEGEERASNLIIALDKEAVDPFLRINELRAARKDLVGAEKILIEAIQRDAGRAETWLRLGRIALDKNLPLLALERFRTGAAKTTPGAEESKAEALKLETSFKLPSKQAKGPVDRIFAMVSKTLDDFYGQQRKQNPKLKGILKVRVKINAQGVVEAAEVVEDSVGDPLLVGHAVFALRDAEFDKKRREPVFEFELGMPPAKKGK